MVLSSSADDAVVQSRRPFNVSSRRFDCPSAALNTNPGPGIYSSACSRSWQHGSLGHKGYGPLVSSSKRLAHTPVYTGPGPGSYSAQSPGVRNPASAAHCTAAFHQPESSSASGSSNTAGSRATPPPGAYGIPGITHQGTAVDWASSRKPGATAAFKATSRGTAPPGSVAVAAAQHVPIWQQQQQQQQRHNAPAAAAMFKGINSPQFSKLGAAGSQTQPGGKHGLAAGDARLTLTSAQLANRISAAVFGVGQPRCTSAPTAARPAMSPAAAGRSVFSAAARAAAEVPGVGSYDLVAVGAISSGLTRQLAAGRCSPMFAQPLVTNRFGASSLQRTQQLQQQAQKHDRHRQQEQQHLEDAKSGHVWHKQQQQPPMGYGCSSRHGVSSPFRSRSPGHSAAVLGYQDAAMAGAPGPAYYSPHSPPDKVSYRHAA